MSSSKYDLSSPCPLLSSRRADDAAAWICGAKVLARRAGDVPGAAQPLARIFLFEKIAKLAPRESGASQFQIDACDRAISSVQAGFGSLVE